MDSSSNTESEPVARSGGFWSIVLASLAIGLVSGFAEVGVVTWQMHSRGRMGVNPDFVWMAPLFYGVATASIGALCAGVRRLFPRVVSWPLAIAVPLGLCAASVLGLRFSGLTAFSLAVLACGIGIQGGRMLNSRPLLVSRVARWTSALLLLVTATIAGYVTIQRRATEASSLAGMPDAEAGAVSVLLLVLDTVGAQHLSLLGYERPTSPQLEKWAARGVTFERAVATASWTLPSHATMMTGLYPHEFSYGWYAPVRTPKPMLAEGFRSRGYLTTAFLGNYGFLPREYGVARGFIHYEAGRFSAGSFIQQAWLMRQAFRNSRVRDLIRTDQDLYRPSASKLNARFLQWMGSKSPNRPYFAFLNYFDAHEPYIPPHDVFKAITGYERTDDFDPLSRYNYKTRKNATADEVRLARDAHDAAIAAQDRDMGALLESMERRGMLRNTVVVIVADHGEEFGEHSVYYHGHTLYSASLHVPLVVLGPGVPRGVRVAEPVTLRDLAATIADLSRLRTPSFPGNSLATRWSNSRVPSAQASPILSETKRGIQLPDHYPTARADAESIIADSLHFIEVKGEGSLLFNWISDPAEKRDLLGTPAGDSAAILMRSTLRTWVDAKTAQSAASASH